MYRTELKGRLKFNKKLSETMYQFLLDFHNTRHTALRVGKKYGVEGEFYTGKYDHSKLIKRGHLINEEPTTQPDIYCEWMPSPDRQYLYHDPSSEAPYCYTEWLVYLIHKILAPNGYILNGTIKWKGADKKDRGVISVIQNKVYYKYDNQKNRKPMTAKNAMRYDGFEFIKDFMRTDIVWKEPKE